MMNVSPCGDIDIGGFAWVRAWRKAVQKWRGWVVEMGLSAGSMLESSLSDWVVGSFGMIGSEGISISTGSSECRYR